MDLYYGLIVLGLAALSAPFWAKLAGYETHRKPFDLVGASGMFFLLAAAFHLAGSISPTIAGMCNGLMIGSFVIGWIGMLFCAFWVAIEVLGESGHGMLGAKAEVK